VIWNIIQSQVQRHGFAHNGATSAAVLVQPCVACCWTSSQNLTKIHPQPSEQFHEQKDRNITPLSRGRNSVIHSTCWRLVATYQPVHVCDAGVLNCAYNDVGWETTYEHARSIQKHYVYLIEKLDVKHGLLDYLRSANVLRQAECESINAEMTATTQTEKLLSVLSRRTKDQFNKFLEALDATGQQHVHSHITTCQGM